MILYQRLLEVLKQLFCDLTQRICQIKNQRIALVFFSDFSGIRRKAPEKNVVLS